MKVLALFLAFNIHHAKASEVANGNPSDKTEAVVTSVSEQPKCFDAPKNLSGSKNPEEIIKNLFKDLSDEEAAARLVFAESLAAGPRCQSQSAAISRGIAWVIRNRRNDSSKRYGDGRGVIFKRLQFRSSFGGCDVAQRQALLCPSSVNKWQSLWSSAKASVRKARHGEGNPLPKARHYFFGKHFKNSKNCGKWDGVKPSWATKSAQVIPDISGLDPKSNCIEFYNVKE